MVDGSSTNYINKNGLKIKMISFIQLFENIGVFTLTNMTLQKIRI